MSTCSQSVNVSAHKTSRALTSRPVDTSLQAGAQDDGIMGREKGAGILKALRALFTVYPTILNHRLSVC